MCLIHRARARQVQEEIHVYCACRTISCAGLVPTPSDPATREISKVQDNRCDIRRLFHCSGFDRGMMGLRASRNVRVRVHNIGCSSIRSFSSPVSTSRIIHSMSSVAPPKVAKEAGSLPNVHKPYPKGNGDIVLISSDNVRFYVKSMHLAAVR